MLAAVESSRSPARSCGPLRRGNHETPGEWSMAGFPKDVDDLRVVARYLREKLNYEIETIM